LRNFKANWEQVRGYLPKYPGPSRYVSQQHVVGGTVAAAIILASIFIVRPFLIHPPISQSQYDILLDKLEDNLDEVKDLKEQITALENESIRTSTEFQRMLTTLGLDIRELSDYVYTLENEIASLQTEIEKMEPIIEQYTWDYVALGITYGQPDTYVEYYADYIEADTGFIIRLHDWRMESLYNNELLSQIRENQELRELIQEAEVITIDIVTFLPVELDEAVEENDTVRIEEITASVKADIDATLDEILTLCSVDNTIIRTDNAYNCWIIEQKELGIYEIAKYILDEIHAHVVVASVERDIPVVMTYQALNGPDGEEMPPENYLTKVRNNMTYLNEAGHVFIAGLYRELGYEPLCP
jgi:hypothetical protein